jgi:ABC-type amino acid transport substrate-binding protein
MLRHLIVFTVSMGFVILPASADTLDRIGETQRVKLGVRTDAAPFSYRDDLGEPAGYAVDLCREVASHLKASLGLDSIQVDYVPVTAEDRFDAVASGRIDLLCGATTHTLSRRERVDFSIPTFIDGAGVLFRADGPQSFEALAGKKVGVRAGTTTETALTNTLRRMDIDAEVIGVTSHNDGIERLSQRELAAYFGDWAILLYLLASEESPEGLLISDRQYSVEPYALALPRGDSDFRLAVDRALARAFRNGRAADIFHAHFGEAKPSETLRALFLINRIPE